MELGIIRQINIDAEMQASYLDYAMSVIVARALPDVRDGLKPVHRRILYAMHDLGLQPDKPYKKSARIVGEVLGKYHPHGDAAVYEAMVRMAQDFSLRYPLVDGQGNFGSIDGDNAAAMRYTEARLAKIATEMLGDIEKDTVDWAENFDGTLKEPTVLPAALPNLLVNGASGIAVGMSTNIPPHNLGEVCDALCYLIDNYDRHEDVTVEDLMRFIPGPDFPTGGVVYRYSHEGNGAEEREDVIAKAYATGRGSIVMQAKAHIEEMSRNRSRIVVTELPYQTNKTNLIERIAELARDGRLEGLTDLRDESDRTGMRICIEMTRTVEPRKVLADLFKLTPLQQTFGMSLLALVDGEPRLLSLKRMLLHFLEHRQVVIVRRARFDLERAKQRAHIVEGLLRALDVLDEVIALIRASRTADIAKQGLMAKFQFTEIQAQAILDMQLRRLAALERKKLQDEYKELLALIKELEALLKSPKKVLAAIKQDLLALKERYSDARRTQIADRAKGALTAMDVLPDEDVWVTLNGDGLLARQRRAAGGPQAAGMQQLVATTTRANLYLFNAKGQATRVSTHQIPEAPGAHYADLSGFSRRDRVVAMFALPKSESDEPPAGFAALATAQGKVKRVTLADLAANAATDPQVIGLDDGDELIWAGVSAGGGEIMLVTAQGQAIRFAEDDVRAMGLPAGGIGGIKLARKDRVIAATAAPAPGPDNAPSHLAVITTAGFAKRVALADFPVQGRYGQGVVGAKLTPKSGALAAAALLRPGDGLLCGLNAGPLRLLKPADVPEMGRATTGKQAVALAAGETVVRAFAIPAGELGAKGEAEVEAKVEAKPARGARVPATAGKTAAKSAPPLAEPPKTTRAHKTAAEPITPAPAVAASKPAAQAPVKAAPPPAEPPKTTRARKAAAEPVTPAPATAGDKPAAKAAPPPAEPAKPTRARKAVAEPVTPAPATAGDKPAAKAAPPPAEPAKPTRARKAAAEPAARAPAAPAGKPAAKTADQAAPPPAEPAGTARARGKAVAVDAAQLALLAEPPSDTAAKQPRATTRGRTAPPATPPEPPKPASGRAKAVTQPEPSATPAKPAGRASKQSPAPVEGAKPAVRAPKKGVPASSTKTTPVAPKGTTSDKTKPPDKPAPPAGKSPSRSRKPGG